MAGVRPRSARHRRVLSGLCLGGGRRGPRQYQPRADDHVPGAVQAGTGGGEQQPERHQWSRTRMACTCRTSMNTWPNRCADTGHLTVGAVPGDGLRFENVGFRYPGASRAALEGIDLHLVPGRSMALVGENGSGKTTLIKLLTRPVPARSGPDPAGRQRFAGLGGRRATPAHRGDFPGLHPLPVFRRREHRRRRYAGVQR